MGSRKTVKGQNDNLIAFFGRLESPALFPIIESFHQSSTHSNTVLPFTIFVFRVFTRSPARTSTS